MRFNSGSHAYLLQDELRNAIPDIDHKVFWSQVEYDNGDIASIVCIDDTGSNVDSLLGGEARTGRDPGIRAGRTSDAKIRFYDPPATGGNYLGAKFVRLHWVSTRVVFVI